MTNLLDELNQSSAGSEQASIKHRMCSLREIAQEAYHQTSLHAQSVGVHLAFPDISRDLQMRTDPARLLQVLLNLLTNAIKYNRPGGCVRIEATEDDDCIRLTVEDTGRGMSQTQLNGLFQPFNRLGMESSNIDGTGIGLALSRDLVEALGGELHVDSERDVGTIATVSLPRLCQAG